MRTTPIEVVWLVTSVIGEVYCLLNYRTYRDDYVHVRRHDPEYSDSYRVNALLNTLRVLGMSCLLFVSVVSAVLVQPVSEAWRSVNQLVLTVAVVSITMLSVIIRRAVKRSDS